LVILLVGLVASALHFATGKGPAIIGDIVFYVVGFWAICIGATRAVEAVRLGWALKAARLMIISGALLGVFGMYLLLDHPWEQRLLLGF
jgi:hypothetical protein